MGLKQLSLQGLSWGGNFGDKWSPRGCPQRLFHCIHCRAATRETAMTEDKRGPTHNGHQIVCGPRLTPQTAPKRHGALGSCMIDLEQLLRFAAPPVGSPANTFLNRGTG